MQINPIQQNNTDPSFGVHYSKKTVRTLKKDIAPMLRWVKNEEDYNLVKSAIKHLINAGKKIDDFCVELNNNETGSCFYEIRAKKITGKCNDFLYPPYKYGIGFGDTYITRFYKQCKFIDSEEFAPQTEKEINEWYAHRTSHSRWKNFKDDADWFWYDFTEILEYPVELIKDFFAITIDLSNGGKKSWYPLEAVKQFFHNKKNNDVIDNANTKEIKEIKGLIDKLRTKPIKINVATTTAKEEPKMIESSKKLIEGE